MAKTYKTMIEHHKEDTGGSGGWNSVAVIKKASLGSGREIHSGFVEKVKVNYILDDISNTSSADSIRDSFPFGVMWAVSYEAHTETIDGDASQLAPNHIIDITARQGGGGVATLYLNRRILENSEDHDEHDGQIYIWMKSTDLTTDDTLVWRMYIETYGRWVLTNGL